MTWMHGTDLSYSKKKDEPPPILLFFLSFPEIHQHLHQILQRIRFKLLQNSPDHGKSPVAHSPASSIASRLISMLYSRRSDRTLSRSILLQIFRIISSLFIYPPLFTVCPCIIHNISIEYFSPCGILYSYGFYLFCSKYIRF